MLTSQAATGLRAAIVQDGWMSVTVPAQAGQEFAVSGAYRSDGQDHWMGVGVDFLNRAGQEIGESVMTLTPSVGFDRFLLNAKVPLQADSLRVWFYAESERQLTVDDLSLVEQNCQE